VRFEWKAISRAIAENLEVLPETYDCRSTHLQAGFRRDLLAFARQIVLTDPLGSTSARQVLEEHRQSLEYVRDLIDRRLAAPAQVGIRCTDPVWLR
jgi:methyl coenzyme M reductase gamma subunit